MRLISSTGLALLAALALGSLGCGGGTGTVSGKVYFQDQSLSSGTVIFTNANGKGNREADIQPDGSYKIEGMPLGPAKVAVVTSPPPSAEVQGRGPMGRGGPPKMPTPPPDKLPPGVDASKLPGTQQPGQQKYVKIPDNYADMEKSGVTYTVTKGPQEWDIKLK